MLTESLPTPSNVAPLPSFLHERKKKKKRTEEKKRNERVKNLNREEKQNISLDAAIHQDFLFKGCEGKRWRRRGVQQGMLVMLGWPH